MTLMSVIVAFLFAISLWYLSSNHKVTFVKLKATDLKFLPNPGTFVFAMGGTFDSDMPGTFESDTGGTFNPLLSYSFGGRYIINAIIPNNQDPANETSYVANLIDGTFSESQEKENDWSSLTSL